MDKVGPAFALGAAFGAGVYLIFSLGQELGYLALKKRVLVALNSGGAAAGSAQLRLAVLGALDVDTSEVFD